jgi:hypothetical protein
VLPVKEFEVTKPFVLGFIVGVALLIVAGVGASRLQRKDATRIDATESERKYQAELVEATSVELGALSEKQRIHSKLFAYYKQIRGKETISGLVAEFRDKNRIIEIGVYLPLTELITESETAEKFFSNIAHASDAVIRGKVTRKISHVTENDAFVFTDYDVIVKEILKNNVAAPFSIDTTITVTRPGGRVLIDGIVIKAIDEAFEPLPINEHDVILFLQLIPETGAYKVTRYSGGYELDGSTLRPLTAARFPPGVLQNGNSLLQTLRDVSKE